MWQLIAVLLLFLGAALIVLSVILDLVRRPQNAEQLAADVAGVSTSEARTPARDRIGIMVMALRVSGGILLFEALVSALLGALETNWVQPASRAALAVQFALATSGAAVVGTLVTTLLRLQQRAVYAALVNPGVQSVEDRIGTAVVPPFLGAIFGLVAYLLVLSDLIMGRLIGLDNGVPNAPKDAAFLLALGFVAGFVEQLIPDMLRQVAERMARSVAKDDDDSGRKSSNR